MRSSSVSNRGGTDGVYRIATDGSTIVFSSDVADPKAGVLDIYMLSLEPVAPSEGT